MLTPEALRAARGLLKWGVREVAAAAQVSWTTISQFENGKEIRASTALKIVSALARHGVEIVTTDEKTGAVLVYSRAGKASAPVTLIDMAKSSQLDSIRNSRRLRKAKPRKAEGVR